MKSAILFLMIVLSSQKSWGEDQENFPLLIDFDRSQVLTRVSNANGFYFQLCDVPQEILKTKNDALFTSLKILKLPCHPINQIVLSTQDNKDQVALEKRFRENFEQTLFSAYHRSSDSLAVATGFSQVVTFAGLYFVLRPFRFTGARPVAMAFTVVLQGVTFFAAAMTNNNWIREEPKVPSVSLQKPLGINPQIYIPPVSAGPLDGIFLFDAFLTALQSAMQQVDDAKHRSPQ